MKQKEIPVFISGDENYAPYMAVLIASACYNTKSFLKFYIIFWNKYFAYIKT